MAFTLYGWSEVSVSLNQGLVSADISPGVTPVNQGSANIFCYNTVDSLATVQAADYFAPQVTSLSVKDIIFVTAADGNAELQVTALTEPSFGVAASVTTAAFLSPGSLISATVALSAANILGLYATPILLVPAQGANNVILVDSIVWSITYGTTQFAAGGVLKAQYGSAANGAGPAASGTIAAATLNAVAANYVMTNAGGAGVVAATRAASANTAVYLSNTVGAFTTGDSTAELYVNYRVVSVA